VLCGLINFSESEIAGAECALKVYIYGLPGDPVLENIRDYFNRFSEVSVTVYYIDDSHCLDEFLEIIGVLTMGVDPVPPNFCASCSGLNWKETYTIFASPLLLIFQSGRLKAIVIQTYNQTLFNQILNLPENTAVLFREYI